MPTPIEQLRNIGPKSAGWLRACGIQSIEDLRQGGAIAAFQKVSLVSRGVSLNLLWALFAGLDDRDWRDLSKAEKLRLRDELRAG